MKSPRLISCGGEQIGVNDRPAGVGRKKEGEVSMLRRKTWYLGVAMLTGIAAASLAFEPAASARDLTIVAYGGTYQDALREVFFKPFTDKTGIAVKDEPYDGGIGIIRAKVQSGSSDWDLIDVEDGDLLIGCEEGLFEKLDWSKIGDKDQFLPGVVSDCGMGMVIPGYVIAYDGDKLSDGPKNWADFFDTNKFPGKRSLRNSPVYTLEVALMADGVPEDQVYAVLSTPEGVDRAFKKLDTIKSSVIWWQSGAQAVQLLASGEAIMISMWNGRIHNAIKNDNKNFKIVWNQEILSSDNWAIIKDSPNLDAAYKFLSFFADPAVQKNFPNHIPNGMPSKKTAELIDKDLLPSIPTNPEYLPHALRLDANFWLENTDKLTDRFSKWVAQ